MRVQISIAKAKELSEEDKADMEIKRITGVIDSEEPLASHKLEYEYMSGYLSPEFFRSATIAFLIEDENGDEVKIESNDSITYIKGGKSILDEVIENIQYYQK